MSRLLGTAAMLLLLTGLAAAFGYAPADAVQGNVYRILYVHVPSVVTGYLAVVVVVIGSIGYLATRRPSWDRMARAAAEMVVCFIGITILTGSIWGKPTWGTWWTWDARLTTAAVLFVIYLGYLLLRSVVEDPERAATYAAVVGILGALDVPIIHFSVQWWRTLHQPATLLRPQAPTMDPSMVLTLAVNIVAFVSAFAYLVTRRYRLLTLEAEAAARVWH